MIVEFSMAYEVNCGCGAYAVPGLDFDPDLFVDVAFETTDCYGDDPACYRSELLLSAFVHLRTEVTMDASEVAEELRELTGLVSPDEDWAVSLWVAAGVRLYDMLYRLEILTWQVDVEPEVENPWGPVRRDVTGVTYRGVW